LGLNKKFKNENNFRILNFNGRSEPTTTGVLLPGMSDKGADLELTGHKSGTKEECLAYIKEVWTDMRPLSLRKKMQAQGLA